MRQYQDLLIKKAHLISSFFLIKKVGSLEKLYFQNQNCCAALLYEHLGYKWEKINLKLEICGTKIKYQMVPKQ